MRTSSWPRPNRPRGGSRRRRVAQRLLTAFLIGWFVVLLGSARDAAALRGGFVHAAGPTTATPPVDPPAVGSYPASDATVQEWIDQLDRVRIRAHAWDVWASITSPSGSSVGPVWETWYSGQDIFGPPSLPAESATRRIFERAHQVRRAGLLRDIPIDGAEQVLSFNRYSPSVAAVIVDRGYNSAATLDAINARFDRERAPIARRSISTSIGTVDASSIVLKPVFQFISGSGPTAVPYWAGVSPQTTTNLDNPTPDTWRQCVVVDPTGAVQAGSRLRLPCNAEAPAEWPVVPLSDFYAIRLTEDEAAAFSQFAEESGDDLGAANQSDKESIKAMVVAGNVGLLVAMHVTTKEITNWTWQTFWWAGDPNSPTYGSDRPAFIPEPWAHYNMDAAYYMVAPATAARGDPLIVFNPYLETNLQGCVPDGASPPCSPGQVSWTGTRSNCMTCHRMAGWGGVGKNPPYWPDGAISPDDRQLFAGYTKTDFLWSIATRAQ
jgi:hypothetical protein